MHAHKARASPRVGPWLHIWIGVLPASLAFGQGAPAPGERPIGPPGGTPGIAARQIDPRGPISASPATPAPSPTLPKSTSPAPLSGPSQVWVDTASRVYHCPGTKWYGKSKQGQYMTEGAAKSAGNRAESSK